MGCGRSRAKVYLADNRDVVDKHTPLFAELGIRNDTVAAAVLANLRITGVGGFGPRRADFDDVQKKGWCSYRNRGCNCYDF